MSDKKKSSLLVYVLVIQGSHTHIFKNERSHRIVLDVMHFLQSAIFYLNVVIFLIYETNIFMLIQSNNCLMMYLLIMSSYS